MASELATMQQFQERVAQRIKEQFVDLIPSEAFDQMVAKASEEFWAKEAPEMVKKALRTHMEKHLTEELSKPEWREQYTNNGYTAGEAVKKVLEETAPVLIQGFFGMMVQQMVSNMRNRGSY